MNKSKVKAPSYKEFLKAVEEWLIIALSRTETKEDVLRYLGTDEAKEVIKNRYEQELEEFEDGEITYEVLMGGVVGSVGYCLYMMYE